MQVWVGKGTESSRLTKKEKKLETSKCHFFKETCVVMEPFMVWWMHLICVLFMHAFHSSSIGWERGQVGPLFKLNQDWKARATVIFPLFLTQDYSVPELAFLQPLWFILTISDHFDPYSTFLWASLVAQMIKESSCNAEDLGSIPGLGRSPGGGHGNPLQYSCLENPHGWRSLEGYSPWGHKELDTTEWLSTAQQHFCSNFVMQQNICLFRSHL